MFRACVCSECGLTLVVEEDDDEGHYTPSCCEGCYKVIDHVHLSTTGDNDVAWVVND